MGAAGIGGGGGGAAPAFSAREDRLHGAPAGEGCSVKPLAVDEGFVSERFIDDVGICVYILLVTFFCFAVATFCSARFRRSFGRFEGGALSIALSFR